MSAVLISPRSSKSIKLTVIKALFGIVLEEKSFGSKIIQFVKQMIMYIKNTGMGLVKSIVELFSPNKIKHIKEGYNAICSTDETKAKFGVLARELFKKYKALMPDQSIYSYKDKRDAINA